jgi:uncharacterized protein HemY
MAIGGLLVLVALAVLVHRIFSMRRSKRRWEKRIQDMESELLRMVSGRQDVAERLVRLEQKRHPDKPRYWHLERAVEQLKRDRR